MMRERIIFWLKISTVPIAAGLWYLVYRAYKPAREVSVEGYFEEKSMRSDFRVIHVRVPKRAVGAVIGKSGQVIQKLQQTTGARIGFSNRDVESNDEELLIRGVSKAVEEAEREVRKIIAAVPTIECEEIRLPARYIGPMIGKNGENIRALMQRTRAKIDVERNASAPADKERLVTVRGTRAQIEEVIEAITNLRAEVDQKDRRAQELLCDVEVLPDTPDLLEVLVSVVKNPVTVNLQLASRSNALDSLIQRMTEYYSQRAPSRSVYRPGSLVAAVYEMDGTWHRARVVDFTPEFVDVDYVDYGDFAELSSDKVRPLTESSFCALPLQAIEVRLNDLDFTSTDEQLKEQACAYLEDITYQGKGVPLHAVVMSREGEVPTVRLTDPNRENADISAIMLSSGLCSQPNT